MATTSDIRKGMCLEHNKQTYIIVEFQHVKPGKGNAFVRTKLKNLSNGKVVEYTFPAGHKIQDVRVERRKYQYLYDDAERLYFMNNETYEQIELPSDILGDKKSFLQDGMIIKIEYHEAEALNATLPDKVLCTVIETEPVVKGQTAANSFKPALLDNNLKINVPPFIGQDEKIIVSTETMEYVERA